MTPREIVQQIEALEPGLEAAYLDEIRSTLDAVTLAEVERLMAHGQPDAVADLIEFGGFILMLEKLRAGFMASGRREIQTARVRVVKLQLDPADAEVERWFRETARQVREAAATQKREAAQQTYAMAVSMGRTARQTALDMVGRLDRTTGRRVGGTLGLAGDQAETVMRARQQLASGDAAQMRKYLTRERRDRRYDGIVNRAIAAGKPVVQADIDKIVGRYADRLLVTRAVQTAKTRALEAVNAGRDEVWRQFRDSTNLNVEITKTWKTRADEKVRASHRHLNGVKVGFDQVFRTDNGALLRFPGDSSLGAGLNELAGCRCSAQYQVRFS